MDVVAAGRYLSLFVAVLHVLFFGLEFFPRGVWSMRKQRGDSSRGAGKVEILYTNQAVYNLVFAAALFWADANNLPAVSEFMLAAIVVCGAFGTTSALTVILFAQALPAAAALAVSVHGRRGADGVQFLAITAAASAVAALVGAWVAGEQRKMRGDAKAK